MKKSFKIIMVIGIIIGVVHIVSAFTLDRTMEYKKITFSSTKVPSEMNGYQIAFITDTHSMKQNELKDVVDELNKRNLDLMLLGGDFPARDGAPERSMKILSQIVATDGIYGVEGNHDRYIELFAAMEKYSITPLSNSGVYIKENFYLAGVEDLWRRNPDIAKATKKARHEDLIILLAHNPDITMLQNTKSVDLILSGHTHGGHITFFGLWAPELTLRKTITKYGQRFMSGWAKSRDGVPVYVSNGTGYLSHALRIFARPQVIIITLVHE